VRLFESSSSGDVLLYHGHHPLHLRQQEVTGCPWSQVGLVLCLSANTQRHVFESTKLSVCQDVRKGIIIRGVQIVRLQDRVDSFEGEVAVRRLLPPLSTRQIFRLHAFAEEVHGWPFNDSKWVAARAFCRRNSPSDCSSFFCSELVATAFQRIGLLPAPPEGLSANNYIPADFSSIYPGAHLPLRPEFRLDAERLVPPSNTKCGRHRPSVPCR
jgi:hypothetical protein